MFGVAPVLPPSANATPTAQCSVLDSVDSTCSKTIGAVDGDEVELSGTTTTPGNNTGTEGTDQSSSSPLPPSVPPRITTGVGGAAFVDENGNLEIGGLQNVEIVEAVPTITLADLVNFRATPGVAQMEPTGWMVIGLPTNFWIQTQAQVQSGILLGQQADVRFTPVGYDWDYGDGTAASSASAGGSWQALRLEEFATTPLSHTYTEPGTYRIESRVSFSAEYRFAAGEWQTIEGVVASTSNILQAIAGSASTVLVSSHCLQKPSAVGC